MEITPKVKNRYRYLFRKLKQKVEKHGSQYVFHDDKQDWDELGAIVSQMMAHPDYLSSAFNKTIPLICLEKKYNLPEITAWRRKALNAEEVEGEPNSIAIPFPTKPKKSKKKKK